MNGAGMLWLACLLLYVASGKPIEKEEGEQYLVGVGIADITGPAADVNMMGYANPGQIVGGIYTRLWARAYIIGNPSHDGNRFVFVNLDACMAAQGVTLGVLKSLKARFGDLYTEANVALSGTHTHSGPGGYLQYVLYDITSLGFVDQSYDALVDGIVKAISDAHDNMQPAQLEVAQGPLLHANVNRSPSAYLANPEGERAGYEHNVDKNMTLLKIVGHDAGPLGAVAWFAVHGTSINNTNKLISGDNKGAAAQLAEKWAEKALSGKGRRRVSGEGRQPFVWAFAQSNVGDTSPNILGAFCRDTGDPCEKNSSTCGGRNEMCIARGPAYEADDYGYASNLIIATRQSEKAQELWASNSSLPLKGAVDFRHSYIDMRNYTVLESNFTRAGKTCSAAMGFSFAAGTTDGPGAFDFSQGDTHGNLFWDAVRNVIKEPTAESIACHAPKPILLDTGNINWPYPWQPAVVEVQVLRVGQLVILGLPGELTTMAGRRLRNAVYETVRRAWGDDVVPVIAGLTNTYSSYVTTFEEYQVQRYEGASTIFGPYTLDAYTQEILRLCNDMIDGRKRPPGGAEPPYLIPQQMKLLPGVVADFGTFSNPIGACINDVIPMQPFREGETVVVKFQAGNPRNNLHTGDSFLYVQRQDGSTWRTVATDNDMSTRLIWTRTNTLLGWSEVTITWTIPPGTEPGYYRIMYQGDKKDFGTVLPFSGITNTFKVVTGADSNEARSVSTYSLGLTARIINALKRAFRP